MSEVEGLSYFHCLLKIMLTYSPIWSDVVNHIVLTLSYVKVCSMLIAHADQEQDGAR